uniref:Glycoprotein hormone subunit beta domain-containing protein n=1 Tax=Oncorhynchus mykiss TaxID=8022 RepID=A0A8C7Q133_ONCMY
MYCTHLRKLQLVIMATLWMTPVRAGTDCRCGSRLNNMSHGNITITICAGLCETTDLNYQSKYLPRSQGVCNFKEWSYKVDLKGCPSGAIPYIIPTDNSNYDLISMATPSCVVNPLEA